MAKDSGYRVMLHTGYETIDILEHNEEELVDILVNLVDENNQVIIYFPMFFISRPPDFFNITKKSLLTIIELRDFLLQHNTPYERLLMKQSISVYTWNYYDLFPTPSFSEGNFASRLKDIYNSISNNIVVIKKDTLTSAFKKYITVNLSAKQPSAGFKFSELFYNSAFDKDAFGKFYINSGLLDDDIKEGIRATYNFYMKTPVSMYIEGLTLDNLSIEDIKTFKELDSFMYNLSMVINKPDEHNVTAEEFEALTNLAYRLGPLHESYTDLVDFPRAILNYLYDHSSISLHEIYLTILRTPANFFKFFNVEDFISRLEEDKSYDDYSQLSTLDFKNILLKQQGLPEIANTEDFLFNENPLLEGKRVYVFYFAI